MSVKNISSTVTVTTTATYSWNILSTACGTQITMSNPTTGTLQPGTTTLTQTVTFPDTCLVNICLEVTEELNCVEQVCFDLSDGSVFTDYSWNCVTVSENQKTCIVEETSNGIFATEAECLACIQNANCSYCNNTTTSCSDYAITATYDCTNGLSLNWGGNVYTGQISCVYLGVNIATAPCTENVLATNINGTQLTNLTGLLPNGTYSVNVNAVLENGCIITSNSIVVNCPGTPQVEWNLECCQTTDTSGSMAGYLDKYYILDITNNDISQPLYIDFSFFQVADRIKVYDYSELDVLLGIPTNLGSVTPIADTRYVGMELGCYPPNINSNLTYGFVEITDDLWINVAQPISVMQTLSPTWSLLMPCNDNYQMMLPGCIPCSNAGLAYNIPKNCANAPNVPDCEPVDIIGCGRLTITPSTLSTVGTVISPNIVGNRKKLFIWLESNDCGTGCTAAVFKVLCPGCYGCDVNCDVTYDCVNGLQFLNCIAPNYIYQVCYYDNNGVQICSSVTPGQILPNRNYTIKIINPTTDNCFKEVNLLVDCCDIPTFRSAAGLCYTNTDEGYVFATFTTAHTNMSIKFLVSTNLTTNPGYVAQQYTGKYLGYGACPSNTCSSYIQLGTGTLNGNYMEYETVNNSVDLAIGDSVFALFNNSSGSILNLPNGEYKFIFIDGDCTAETSFTVNCGCITPEFKSPFVSFLVTDPSSAYFTFETLTTHQSGVMTVGIKNPSAGYITGQYDNQWLKLTPTTITDPSAYGTNIYYVPLLHESTPSIPGYADTYKTAAVSLVSPVRIWGIYDNTSNIFPPHNPIDVTNCEKLLFSITDGTCNGYSTVPITVVACESCESELTSFNVYPAISFYNDYLLGAVGHYFGGAGASSANGTVVDVRTDLNNSAYVWSLPDRVAQPTYLQAKDTANSDTLITTGLPDNQFIPISFTSNTMNNNNISLTPTNVSTEHTTWIYHNGINNTQYNPVLGFALTNFVCIPGSDNMRLDIELQVQIPATNVVINSTNITNNNIVGQLLSTGSYPGITTLTFGVMTSHGNNNVAVDLDLTNTTATSTVPAFTNLAQSFNLTFNLDCTDVL